MDWDRSTTPRPAASATRTPPPAERVRSPNYEWGTWARTDGSRMRTSRSRAARSSSPVAPSSTIGMSAFWNRPSRSEEQTSELQSHHDIVCPLLLEKKKFPTLDTLLT